MKLSEAICFSLSRKLMARELRSQSHTLERARGTDTRIYSDWRAAELHREFSSCFDVTDVNGKDVLDFGCGEGQLSFFVSSLGAKSVVGSELSSDLIGKACAQGSLFEGQVKPRFVLAKNAGSIDFPDQSFDTILCFDVLEHIIEYPSIIAEWRRVLRQGGKVLVAWQPWWHPYGHHIRRFIRIPWAHVLFSESVLIRTCARIYDLAEYQPRSGEIDETGAKRPNPWNNLKSLSSLNRLTISRFEKTCRLAQFRQVRREFTGLWRSTPLGAVTQALTLLPGIRDYFCANAVYDIAK